MATSTETVPLSGFSSTARKVLIVDENGNVINDSNKLPVEMEGDIQIGAVEIKDATTDNRVSVDESGALKVTGGASSVNAQYISPTDFTATYTSSTTITLSSLPFTITDSSQIAYVTVIPVSGDASTYVNGASSVTMTVSSNVLTISGVTSPFASGDVYQVGLNAQKKAYDPSTNADMNTILNPDYERYTDSSLLVSAQDLTASYADFGSEIDMRGYTHLGVFITTDVNDSEDVDLKVLGKHSSGGTDEYEIDGLSVKRLWSGTGTDGKTYYEFDVGTIPFIQLQAIAGTLGATAGDLTIYINKVWK